MAEIEVYQEVRVQLTLTLDEVRALLFEVAPEGAWFKGRASSFRPQNSEDLVGNILDKLRKAYDDNVYKEKKEEVASTDINL